MRILRVLFAFSAAVAVTACATNSKQPHVRLVGVDGRELVQIVPLGVAAPEPAAEQLTRLSTLTVSQLNTRYLFDGIIYWDFEDAGMVPTELRDHEALAILEDLKYEAFCFSATPEARTGIDQLRSDHGRRVTAGRMRATVRFVGHGERRGALTTNQCRSGDVVIESIRSFRPLRSAPSPRK